jgi:sugar lactone lactonase YvrE
MKKNTIFKYCVSLAMGLALSSSLCASYDVTTVAGVAGSFAHTDGVGSAAGFKSPGMMSIDNSSNLLIADTGDKAVRKVTTAGGIYTVSTLFYADQVWGGEPLDAICQYIVAGTTTYLTTHQYIDLMQWTQIGGTYVFNNSLNRGGSGYPWGHDAWGLVVDSSNNIFMTSSAESKIYKILPDGSYSSFVQNTALNGLTGITIDSSNNLYVSATSNNTICKITPAGVITAIAGTAGSSGSTDAAGSSARFNSPWDIDIDAAGNLYIADRGNNSIRKLTLSGATYTASTIAGSAGSPGSTDGTGSAARFNTPTGLAVDASGNIFVTDTGNNTIRRLAYVPPTTITIEVDGTDSATVSAPLAATTVHKTGAGTSVLSGNNSSVSTLSIDAGLVKVAATNNMGASLAFAGGNMEVTSGTVAVPTAAVNAAATITTDSGAAVSSIAAPSGSALLTLAGSGVITAGDMSASATPLSIPGVMHVGASSSSKMPTGVATVPNGGLVKIMGNTASSVPGATQLQSGAVLEVADSIAVPAHTGADIFGTLKFDSGSMLKLGASSTWARNISVGTAL